MGSRTDVTGIGWQDFKNDAGVEGLAAAKKYSEFVRRSREDLYLGGLEVRDSKSPRTGQLPDVK
jgi:hypothetical protein